LDDKKQSTTENGLTERQTIYRDIIKQPLAPMVLRVGVVNLAESASCEDVEAAISKPLVDISNEISKLAQTSLAGQIYSQQNPILRLVSSFDLSVPESQSVTSEYFKIHHVYQDNLSRRTGKKTIEHQIAFESDIREGHEDETFDFRQVSSHSDLLLVIVDDGSSSEEVINQLNGEAEEGEVAPFVMSVQFDSQQPAQSKISLLGLNNAQLSDALSEILLFDSLFSASPVSSSASEKSNDSDLKSHTLKRIADYVDEVSFVINEEQPDFDYQGPIRAKPSFISWRNIFTRFINFLSPLKHQKSLQAKVAQSDDSVAVENLSAMRRSQSCQTLYALFMRSDQLAIRYANAHRSSFILIYCLGAFALVNAAIAIGFSDIGWLALSSALAEFFALVAIFLIYRNDHKSRYHIKWLEYRSLAEILRVSPHLNSLGMVFTTKGLERHRSKENEANLSAHSVGRTWLIIYSESIKRWLDCSNNSISQKSLQQGRAFLTDKLIAGQVNYHHKNAHRMHIAGHNLGKFSYVLFVLAFLFVSGKLLTKLLHGMDLGLNPEELHHIGHYLGFLAAICPMLGSAAFAIRNHAEFDISSQRSQTMLKKLNRQLEEFEQLGQSIAYQKLQKVCQETALIMQSETADWLEIYEVKETEPA